MPLPTLTDARYQGKICEKHPEMLGIRRKSNAKCVACIKERVKLSRRQIAAEKALPPEARRANRDLEWEKYREDRDAGIIPPFGNDKEALAEALRQRYREASAARMKAYFEKELGEKLEFLPPGDEQASPDV